MKFKLGQLVDSVSITHSFPNDEIIFLNTSDILEGEVLKHTYTDVNVLPGQAKKSIQHGDILYSEIRPKNERYAFVDFISDDYVVSTKLMVLRVKENVMLNNKFLYYYLTSKKIINHLQNLAESRSGTFPQITFSEVSSLEIELPTIEEQERIVRFMNDLNGKLNLNNSSINKLEELAQTLFKRWFVDFEFPNENGDPYKSSGGKMVESELGMIPKGWEIDDLGKISLQNGNPIKIEELKSHVPYIGLEHMPRGSVALIKWGSSEEVSSNKTQFKKGDILFGKLRPYFKKIGIAQIDGVCSTDILVLNTIEEAYYCYFISFVSQNSFIEYCTATATGTRMPRTGWKQISQYKIVKPPKNIAIKFDDILKPLYSKISKLIFEIDSLNSIRDSLLPKLLSGEIELPDNLEVTDDVPIS